MTSWTRLTSPPNLKRVTAFGGGEDIGDLNAVLVGLGDAGQSVGHAEGDDSGGDTGTGGIGAGGFEVATLLEVDLIDRCLGDLGGEAGDQEALVVAGGGVGGGRAVGEGVGRAVAVGAVIVGEVEVDEDVVAAVDVPVEAREEEVLFLEARGWRVTGSDIGYIEQELMPALHCAVVIVVGHWVGVTVVVLEVGPEGVSEMTLVSA